ncbi:MAG: DnaA N-terminal domain-containing protein [Arenibacterium sp.]
MAQDRAGLFSPGKKIVGAGAQAIKYDVLSALLVVAAQGEPVAARLALRLSLVITARYNWRAGFFAVGQKELARMWGVTERTAKREVSAMRARGWITLSVPAARGRVAQHRIELPTILRDTMAFWPAIGSDFVARMSSTPEPEAPSNVVPLHPVAIYSDPDDSGWAAAATRLQAQDPAVFNAWFAGLQVLEATAGVLTLAAPSRFVADYVRTHFLTRLLVAVVAENRAVRDVQIVVAET